MDTINKRTQYDIGTIFREHADEYMAGHKLAPVQRQALLDICACRTNLMGGHILTCDKCGHTKQAYNSCRNRHCPKCLFIKQAKWVDKLQAHLPVCRYSHIVFTVPQPFRRLFYLNQRICYDLLFKAASTSLKKTANNPEFLGAQTGSVAILHTWGSNLSYHPHLHFIVPAGGISHDQEEWLSKKGKFFLPVKVLSSIYRGVFWSLLKKQEQNLKLPENTNFQQINKACYEKDWNVYVKNTLPGPKSVVEYLGRYTHRVAISNQRIVKVDQNEINFRYKNYRLNGKVQLDPLGIEEFMKRFLWHVLPKGFYKIRYFGFLSAINGKVLSEIKQLIGRQQHIQLFKNASAAQVIFIMYRKEIDQCPKCKDGRLKPPKGIIPK